MKKLTTLCTNLVERFIPDAFVFAILLSVITILLAWILGSGSLGEQLTSWSKGMWDLNNFAMQMAMILITGSTLAKTKFTTSIITTVATKAKNPIQASMLVTLVSMTACAINWGLGLVVGALIATEVQARMEKGNYALLLANAYSGFLIWHGGLSSSIALKLTDPTGVFAHIMIGPVALSESLGGGMNILLFCANAMTIFVVNYYLAKLFGHESYGEVPNSRAVAIEQVPIVRDRFSEKIEHAKWPLWIVFGILAYYILNSLWEQHAFSIDSLIVIFLALSLSLSSNVRNFLNIFTSSVQDAAGILLQFPFYAGIMAVMTSSGLAQILSEFFVKISNGSTFLFFTYLSAGLLNLFIPSGGGQWAIQGPIMLPAAQKLGLDVTETAMAIAWGDAWTNMIQPFWALPLLSIAKIKMQKLMSYTVVIFLSTGIISSICFVAWSIRG